MAEIDKEKVIEILSRHKTMTFGDLLHDGIKFDLGDVVTLLKEQEPIKPVISRSGQYFCGGCRGYLCSTGKESGVRHCNYCGRSVKWE